VNVFLVLGFIATTSFVTYKHVEEVVFLIFIAIFMSGKASYTLEKHAKQDFLLKRLVEVSL
jgi:hypothetical protein